LLAVNSLKAPGHTLEKRNHIVKGSDWCSFLRSSDLNHEKASTKLCAPFVEGGQATFPLQLPKLILPSCGIARPNRASEPPPK